MFVESVAFICRIEMKDGVAVSQKRRCEYTKIQGVT